MADGQTPTLPSLTPDQAVAMMQYAYPGRSQGWYDQFRQNPSLAMGVNIGGQAIGSQGELMGGQSSTDLASLLQAFGQQQGGAGAASGAAQGAAQGGTGVAGPGVAGQSYYGGTQMANGGSTYVPGASTNLIMPGGGALSASQTKQIMDLYTAYEGGDQQAGQQLVQWTQGMGMNTGQLNTAVSNLRSGTGPNAPQQSNVPPETAALQQMAQIDPTGETLRQSLGQSYLANLGGGPPAPQFGGIPGQVPQFGGMPQFNLPSIDLSRGAAAPATGDVQSYLNLYKQIDPTGFAARQKLGTDLAAQEALGTQLDPATVRQLQQQTRQGQIARGNVYGTPQLVAEAMTTGQAGLALQQQRQQALQGYLTSGASMGDVANTLYNQGYGRYLQGYGTALQGYQTQANAALQGYGAQLQGYQTQANAALGGYGAQLQGWQAQQNARLASQGAALGYLGSGQTPYQAGASFVNMANQNAAQAAQGGPQYNPQALGQQYTGTGASSYPQYGLDMSQLAGNWYNNINQANLQAYGLQQQASAQRGGQGGALGGGIGTALGGVLGSVIPGVGTAIGGAVGGAVGSAAGSYIG